MSISGMLLSSRDHEIGFPERKKKTFFQKRTFLTKYLLDASFTSSPDCMVQDFFLSQHLASQYMREYVHVRSVELSSPFFSAYMWQNGGLSFAFSGVSRSHQPTILHPPLPPCGHYGEKRTGIRRHIIQFPTKIIRIFKK